MSIVRASIVVKISVTLLVGCASTEPTGRVRSEAEPRIKPTARATVAPMLDAPVDLNDVPSDDSEPALFRRLTEVFGREGEIKDGVYRLVTPRDDLFVTMDGMDVPPGAFLESDFRFWRCPCGKALVNGQFVVADYEANDVVDELQEGHLHVVALAPLLLHEKPRLMMIRFQGEGQARELAAALKSALSYTGKERHAPEPANLSPPNE